PTEREVELTVADFAILPESSPIAAAASQQVTLSWTLENASSSHCVVSDDLGGVPDEDAAEGFQVTVTTSTVFTVSCQGNNPSAPLLEEVYVPVLIEDIPPLDVVSYESTATITFTASTGVTECRVGGELVTA